MKHLKTAGWIAVGITAIAVEKSYKGIKHVHNEVKSGRPQKLVRYHCNKIMNLKQEPEQKENIVDSFVKNFSKA